jgi:hypothetical protein
MLQIVAVRILPYFLLSDLFLVVHDHDPYVGTKRTLKTQIGKMDFNHQ